MKYLSILACLAVFIFIRCSTEDITGVYVCQDLKGLGVSVQDKVLEAADSDSACLFTQLEFKAENAVIITTTDTSFTSSYIRDNKVIKVQRPDNDFTFTIRADGTLEGQGSTRGIYTRK